MSENLQQIKDSRNHHRNKVKQVKRSRNRIVQGLSYWKGRALAAEDFIVHGGERVQILAGDTVHIKSGSPRMTITAVAKTRARVVYCAFGTNTVIECSVPLIALEKK